MTEGIKFDSIREKLLVFKEVESVIGPTHTVLVGHEKVSEKVVATLESQGVLRQMTEPLFIGIEGILTAARVQDTFGLDHNARLIWRATLEGETELHAFIKFEGYKKTVYSGLDSSLTYFDKVTEPAELISKLHELRPKLAVPSNSYIWDSWNYDKKDEFIAEIKDLCIAVLAQLCELNKEDVARKIV